MLEEERHFRERKAYSARSNEQRNGQQITSKRILLNRHKANFTEGKSTNVDEGRENWNTALAVAGPFV